LLRGGVLRLDLDFGGLLTGHQLLLLLRLLRGCLLRLSLGLRFVFQGHLEFGNVDFVEEELSDGSGHGPARHEAQRFGVGQKHLNQATSCSPG
jgi:hypothetical protein